MSDCACQGRAPQMREHTPMSCSVITQAELNALWPAVEAQRALTKEEQAILKKALIVGKLPDT